MKGRKLARALERGCVECRIGFTRGDIENEDIAYIKGEPYELMHIACRDRLIERTLTRMVREGKLEREWDSKAGEYRYIKAVKTGNLRAVEQPDNLTAT